MKDDRLNQIVEQGLLAEEWDSIFLNVLPKNMPLNRLQRWFDLHYVGYAKRKEAAISALYNLAVKKQQGKQISSKLYSEEQIATDSGKRTVRCFNYVINANAPLAIILPGGGYDFVSVENEGLPVAEKLNSLGINALVLTYRTAQNAAYPNPLTDVNMAIEYAKTLNCRQDSTTLWGFSAGGHLAALYAANAASYSNDGYVKGICLGYPVTTLCGAYAHKQTAQNLCGNDQMLKAKLSIQNAAKPDFPKAYLWHCVTDICVNVNNSLMLGEALKKLDVPHKIRLYKTGCHGLGTAEGCMQGDWLADAVNYLYGQATPSNSDKIFS